MSVDGVPYLMVIGYLLSFEMILFFVAIAQGGFAFLPQEKSGRSRTKSYTRRVRRTPNEHNPTERSKPFTTLIERTGLPIKGPSFIEDRAVTPHGQSRFEAHQNAAK